MNPFSAGLLAWQAGWVFTVRSMQLWAEPAQAQSRLAGYALEKQKVFLRGMADAGGAVLRGQGAEAVMAAAVAPANRRLRANVRQLGRG